MSSEETSLQEPAVAVSEAPRDDALLACLLLLARTHGETLTAEHAEQAEVDWAAHPSPVLAASQRWIGHQTAYALQPGQPLEVPLDQLPPLQPNQLFEITLEPYNGSPTGKPTGPILYIGRSVKLNT